MNICIFFCSEVNREEYKVIFSFRGCNIWRDFFILFIEVFKSVLLKGSNFF